MTHPRPTLALAALLVAPLAACSGSHRSTADAADGDADALADAGPDAAGTRCAILHAPCAPGTLPSADDDLACVPADTRAPEVLTCEPTCASGSCADLPMLTCTSPYPGAPAVCLASNCASIFASAAQCADASADGGTCEPLAPGRGICSPAGQVPPGGACDLDTPCRAGLLCADGRCSAPCTLDDDTVPCGLGETCAAHGPGVPGRVGVCRPACGGFAAAKGVCGPGSGCQPTSSDAGYCAPVGSRALGEACDDGATCGERLACLDLGEGAPPTCLATCDRGAPDLGDAWCDGDDVCVGVGSAVVGVCLPGCTPFVPDADNGCAEAGRRRCQPLDDGTRGLCLPSGSAPAGSPCNDADIRCVGTASCVGAREGHPGTCRAYCRPFTSPTGCGSDEICNPGSPGWGQCTDNVASPRIGALAALGEIRTEPGAASWSQVATRGGSVPEVRDRRAEPPETTRASLATGEFPRALLEGCPTPGQWCDEGVLCLNSGDGGNACVALCRFAAGDDDCAGTTCTADILTSEEIGLCLP